MIIRLSSFSQCLGQIDKAVDLSIVRILYAVWYGVICLQYISLQHRVLTQINNKQQDN